MNDDCEECQDRRRSADRDGGAIVGVWLAVFLAAFFPVTAWSLCAIIASGILGWIVVWKKQSEKS